MTIHIKSATIIDVSSKYHNKKLDILIKNGVIKSIGRSLKTPKNAKCIQLQDLHVSQGWLDTSVSFGEPGFEMRETIENGLQTAAKSGFTNVILNSNTNPVLDTAASLFFIAEKAKNKATTLHYKGALTNGNKGEALAELFDMKQASAVAFYDYKQAITNANLLKIALQYVSNFNGLVCTFPQTKSLTGKGIVNESANTTRLGLKGNPALSESLQVARDLQLLEYTGGKLHIETISTKTSVELIKAAKNKGLDVSCSVAMHNLFFDDSSLNDFNTNYKVNPPLRSKQDIKALIKGLKEGTIDFVTTDHYPLNIEEKQLEFDHAAFGTIGLESAFGALLQLFTLDETIAILTRNKDRFGITNTSIEEGNKASLSLFNPHIEYTFNESCIASKSKNSAFLGQVFTGKPYGIVNQSFIEMNNKN